MRRWFDHVSKCPNVSHSVDFRCQSRFRLLVKRRVATGSLIFVSPFLTLPPFHFADGSLVSSKPRIPSRSLRGTACCKPFWASVEKPLSSHHLRVPSISPAASLCTRRTSMPRYFKRAITRASPAFEISSMSRSQGFHQSVVSYDHIFGLDLKSFPLL